MVRRVGHLVALSAFPVSDPWNEPTGARELLERARPLFVSAVALAAERMSAEDRVHLRGALARMRDPSAQVRADAYRSLLKRIAAASGSSFHRAAISAIVAEFGTIIELGMVHDTARPAPSGQGDVERLCDALDIGNGRLAAQAAEDHLLVVGQIIDQVMLSAS